MLQITDLIPEDIVVEMSSLSAALDERIPGDFNIDRNDDPLYKAFTCTGLYTPLDLNLVPRTLFSDPDKPQLDKFYDQIAWFPAVKDKPAFSLRYSKGGCFDFAPHVLRSRKLDRTGLSWRISDHYPLWVEFKVR